MGLFSDGLSFDSREKRVYWWGLYAFSLPILKLQNSLLTRIVVQSTRYSPPQPISYVHSCASPTVWHSTAMPQCHYLIQIQIIYAIDMDGMVIV